MSASLVRSQRMKRALSPSFLAAASRAATLMSAMTTLQPYPASVSATDCPISVEPPATIAVLPSSPRMALPRYFLHRHLKRLSRAVGSGACDGAVRIGTRNISRGGSFLQALKLLGFVQDAH